jgi:hypothetical protein
VVAFDPLLSEGVTAGLVEIIPGVVDGARGVARPAHAGESSLDAVGSGPVDPQQPTTLKAALKVATSGV